MTLEEINSQYEDWQNDLSIRSLKLKPPHHIQKNEKELDFFLSCLDIPIKTLKK